MASLYNVCKKRKRIINVQDILIGNQYLLKRVVAGMRRRMQGRLQKNGGHIEGNGNYPRTLEIRIYYVFVLNIEIKISCIYYQLLLDVLEYVI